MTDLDRVDLDEVVSEGRGGLTPVPLPGLVPSLGSVGERPQTTADLPEPITEAGELEQLRREIKELRTELERVRNKVFPSWPRRLGRIAFRSLPPLMSGAFILLLAYQCAPIKKDQLFTCMDRVAASDGDPEQSAELNRLLGEIVEEESRAKREELAGEVNKTVPAILIERVAAMYVCADEVIPTSRADFVHDIGIWVERNEKKEVSSK